ncbi:MAG: zinc ABC transporter substrate-binding protein [Erysipelotrichaceae bacterium]|nr:zinc ABC transporter substrate-binding protein [Erysipelotrichaceae bacterium]
MKKLTVLLFSLFLLLSGCAASAPASEGKLSVVTTIYPLADWAEEVIGDEDIEVTCLLQKGVDLHNYQPSAADILKITNADLFLYVGGVSDEWVEDVLVQSVKDDIRVLNLFSISEDRIREEEIVEGMEAEAEHEEETEYDEHLWLSLRNASYYTGRISEELSALDPDHAAVYAKNAETYQAKLLELDEAFVTLTDNAAQKVLLFGDRFPFRYLCEDYGLSYYAAFPGCSAETEASFETVLFLSDKVRELALPAVLTIDGSDQKIARTIVDTAGTGAKILTLNSLQNAGKEDGSYLQIMQKNYEVLQEALSR